MLGKRIQKELCYNLMLGCLAKSGQFWKRVESACYCHFMLNEMNQIEFSFANWFHSLSLFKIDHIAVSPILLKSCRELIHKLTVPIRLEFGFSLIFWYSVHCSDQTKYSVWTQIANTPYWETGQHNWSLVNSSTFKQFSCPGSIGLRSTRISYLSCLVPCKH